MKTLLRFAGFAFLVGLCTSNVRGEETAVVKVNTVNVRGQPSFLGETITQLKRGEKVIILEEISVDKPKPDEPSKWLKIQMPANTPVWIQASFIDPQAKTVKPARLNMRAGPGERFSVVGRLQRGNTVKEIRTIEDWMEIEMPPGTYAFIAADMVQREAPATPPPVVAAEEKKPEPPPTTPAPVSTPPPPVVEKNVAPTPVPVAQVIETPAKTETVQPAPPPPLVATTSPADTPPTTTAKPLETPSAPPPKRIVTREGVVHRTVSVQAPTYFELVSPESGKVINYLHLNSALLEKLGTDLKQFKDYLGRNVAVSGEEGIDPRWPKIPVIEVETLKLIL